MFLCSLCIDVCESFFLHFAPVCVRTYLYNLCVRTTTDVITDGKKRKSSISFGFDFL